MKKLISFVVALAMMMSLNAFACYDKMPADVFNNPYFDIVATIKDAPAESVPAEAEVLANVRYCDYDFDLHSFVFSECVFYSDGSYTMEKIMETGSYELYPASHRFPGNLENTEGFYVGFENSEEMRGDEVLEYMYLFDTNGDEVVKTLIGGRIWDYDIKTLAETHTIFFLDDNGNISQTPTYNELSETDFDKLIYGSEYNDGLKFAPLPADDEWGVFSAFTDINDKVYFTDLQLTYFGYFYNLGYLVTSSNNGDTLDYSGEDPEAYRVYCSTMENVFTGETISFHDVNIVEILDSGYMFLAVKDETRKETYYIAKIKKPAITKVMVDGDKVLFDVLPTIKEGRTLVPLRAIFEALGAKVEWDSAAQKVIATKGDLSVELVIGSNEMKVGAETKILDVAAQIEDGRTLVPARAVAEAFGCAVDWNDADKAVIITTK